MVSFDSADVDASRRESSCLKILIIWGMNPHAWLFCGGGYTRLPGCLPKRTHGCSCQCSNVTAWRDGPSGEYPALFCGLTLGLSQVDRRLTLNSHLGWLHMVQEGVFWCWEWGRLWVRALERCGEAALCYFCPWSRRVLQSWALCTRLPPSSFLGACASPYVNPGEYKLGGPHPGGSHHQPVAWAPLQKSNLTERAEMQQQLRERTDRSLFPPNHCYLL